MDGNDTLPAGRSMLRTSLPGAAWCAPTAPIIWPVLRVGERGLAWTETRMSTHLGNRR